MFLKSKPLDSRRLLSKHFTPYQIKWIEAEIPFHNKRKRVMALAEKSVRIGWTYADAFKNVRKRLWFRDRDYLFATKDYQSALEYIQQCYRFAEIFNLTHTVVTHGEESLQVNSLDEHGRPSALTQDVKVGVIKFDNGSRIIAFSANPQAMAVYGGDVGLDEFAKHPNAKLLWETAQGRITWGYDMAVWSSHDGEDTLFNEFAQEARASGVCSSSGTASHEGSQIPNPQSLILPSTWNVYFRVTMADAISEGLVELINRARGTSFTRQEFLNDCRARAGQEEIFQQAYMCNPMGASANHVVEWSAVERCRYDYAIIRTHFEHAQIIKKFGAFSTATASNRQEEIKEFIRKHFSKLFKNKISYRLGFDVAASGQGDLAVIYIDEAKGEELWLRGLFTCRTEDWDFLQTVLYTFMRELHSVQAAGDSSGLGQQICWQAEQTFGSAFIPVNFSSKKHELGFALMNQLAVAQKRFPTNEQDISADYFALHKSFNGNRWVFSEGRNSLNAASHCDIAWAGALATHAPTQRHDEPYALVLHENGWFDGKNFYPHGSKQSPVSAEQHLLWSDDPRIWSRWG